MSVLLISTYDLGRQPFGLASPAAWLREAGIGVTCVDLAKERLPEEAVKAAELVGFYLPMHTATRLALPVIDRVREWNPSARLVAYGLYAPLNDALLRAGGVGTILGGEFEQALVDLARFGSGSDPEMSPAAAFRGQTPGSQELPRLEFRVPARDTLPPLTRYATLHTGDNRRIVGYTEASRGCKHRCRHCPIVPVYDGRFRIVAVNTVLADIRAQVESGARHITFGDPDFFNGPRTALEIVQRLARECPGVTYDVTIKVEHLLKHAAALPVLRDTGCAFVTSAVESLDDEVLAKLEKGHTRADFEEVVTRFREAGLTLAPTFVAFTPWTTIGTYLDLLHTIDRLDLVEHVAPIQFAIRLLIPQGSRMLELPDIRALAGPFDATWLTHPWTHPDPRVDALQETISHVVGMRLDASRSAVFCRIWNAAHRAASAAPPPRRDMGAMPRATVPYLDEPWYC
ncbi:MAG: radical SAM protein [Acidobacteria bacterium RIFCSPLOWO2_02_FULL_67_36]|nr:MAG: radical SAM protein [Acidobacteria bacterium RIFCSPLOWO2_02_FULL_67_36]OFW25635.1 MAG: radical SAM protein [Acidobacteria bacterium RIFCSPLOWO2_12_FULL_66_21]